MKARSLTFFSIFIAVYILILYVLIIVDKVDIYY